MAYNYEYPYTDPSRANADWILNRIRELTSTIDNFVNVEKIDYADPILWNITTQYKKNIVVLTDNGTAYLSRKPVPGGILIGNTEYWLKLGIIPNLTDIITIKRQKIVLIGDSYGTKNGAYLTTDTITDTLPDVIQYYGGFTDNIYHKYVNGAGFANGGFLNNLQSLELPDDITDIYVMGGWNDETTRQGVTEQGVITGMENFANYVKAHFPYVKYHLIFVASGVYHDIQTQTSGDGYYSEGLRNAWRLYKKSGEYGFAFHNDASYVLHNSALIQQEGIHPNQNGVYELAKAIVSIIRGGTASYNYPVLSKGADFTRASAFASDNIVANGLTLYEQVSELGIKIDFYTDSNYVVLNYGAPTQLSFGNNPLEIINRMPKASLGFLSFLNTKVNAFVVLSDNTRIDFVTDLFITPKKIYLVLPYRPDYAGGTYLPETMNVIAVGIGRAHTETDEIYAQ